MDRKKPCTAQRILTVAGDQSVTGCTPVVGITLHAVIGLEQPRALFL